MGLNVIIKAELTCDYCKRKEVDKSWFHSGLNPDKWALGFNGISRLGEYTYLCDKHDPDIKQFYLNHDNPIEPTA